MWFKVVFDNTGGVRSCDIVSTLYEGTDLVVFVDANNRAEAIDAARHEYANRRKRATRGLRVSQGLCTERMAGCAGKARPGQTRCQNCADRHHDKRMKKWRDVPKGKPGAPRGIGIKRRAVLVEVLEKVQSAKSVGDFVRWLADEIRRIDDANAEFTAEAAE